MSAIPPDVWEGIRTAGEIATNIFLGIRAQSKKIVPKPPPRPEPKYIERHDQEGRDLVGRVNAHLQKRGMVTLTGAGGVGKTTIAKEIANRLFEKRIGGFKEGIVWVSADGRPDFGLVSLVDNVLTQLVPEEQAEAIRRLPLDAKRELARRLLGDRKRCLLTLDNFETIPEEEQGPIVAYLTELLCPRLITSRKPLPKGEEIAVGPMTPQEARAFLKMRIEASAEPDRLKGLDLDQVAKTAGYNPMLMRWVVAQLEQAMRPQDVFDEIARGKGDAVDRIFGRTFRLLGDDGQMVLLALALFVPTASREALAAVCGFEDGRDRVNEAIRRLAAFDLLDTAVEGDRLGIVALTRRLTEAQLKKDERTEGLKEHFVAHFLAYAQAHPKVTKQDLDALEEHRENLLAALDCAYAAEDWEALMRLTRGFEDFLDLRGYWDEAIKRGEQAIEAARRVHDERALARFACNTAIIYQKRGGYREAEHLHNQSLEIDKQTGNRAGMAISFHNLGIIAQQQGHYQEARDFYNRSLEIEKQLGNQAGIASSLHQLGMVAELQGNYEQGQSLYYKSLQTFKDLGAKREQAAVLHNLGWVVQLQGNHEQAKSLYYQSLQFFKDLGAKGEQAAVLHNLGMIAHDQGHYRKAKELCNQSLEIKRQLGDQVGIANSLHQLGIIAEHEGDYQKAKDLYNQTLEIARNVGNQAGMAKSLTQLGLLAEKRRKVEEAAKLYGEALEIFERLGSPYVETARESLTRVTGKKTKE